jgi:hypothetical protein
MNDRMLGFHFKIEMNLLVPAGSVTLLPAGSVTPCGGRARAPRANHASTRVN